MKAQEVSENPPRLCCTFCGAEIGAGEPYWYINGFVVCAPCLPEFARQEYLPCRCVRGREGRHDAE